MRYLVDAASTVREAESNPNVLLLDARPREHVEEERIQGARWVDWIDWADRIGDPPRGLRRPAYWADAFVAARISPASQIHVFDGGKSARAATIWFALSCLGVEDAKVVNGGYPELRKALPPDRIVGDGRSFVQDEGPDRFLEPRVAARPPVPLAELADVQEIVRHGGVQLLDARTEDEFAGRDLRDNPRGGHLPGALNFPVGRVFDPQTGRFKPADVLRSELESLGIREGQPILAYCQGGGRSAGLALALVDAGFGPVPNYWGSFGEWSKNPDLPVVNPNGV